MKKLILGAMFAGALAIVPAVATAQEHDGHDQMNHDSGDRTYHDNAHKDDHQWSDSENTHWSQYRHDHHVKQSDFSKASHQQQQAYWNWRHQHGDSH